MRKRIVTSVCLILTAIAFWQSGSAHRQPGSGSPSAAPPRAFLDQYCADCHNDQLRTGSMTLTELDPAHPDRSAELAEKVIRKLRVGLMPPPGMPRPSPAEAEAFVSAMVRGIDQAAAGRPSPGRPAP